MQKNQRLHAGRPCGTAESSSPFSDGDQRITVQSRLAPPLNLIRRQSSKCVGAFSTAHAFVQINRTGVSSERKRYVTGCRALYVQTLVCQACRSARSRSRGVSASSGKEAETNYPAALTVNDKAHEHERDGIIFIVISGLEAVRIRLLQKLCLVQDGYCVFVTTEGKEGESLNGYDGLRDSRCVTRMSVRSGALGAAVWEHSLPSSRSCCAPTRSARATDPPAH